MVPPPPRSTLFPYTTLFRSAKVMADVIEVLKRAGAVVVDPADIPSIVDKDRQQNYAMWSICSGANNARGRSEEHTSELQSRLHLVCRLLLEKKKKHLHDPVL